MTGMKTEENRKCLEYEYKQCSRNAVNKRLRECLGLMVRNKPQVAEGVKIRSKGPLSFILCAKLNPIWELHEPYTPDSTR